MFASTQFSVLAIIVVTSICPAVRVDAQAKDRKPKSSTIVQRNVLSPREIASRISQSLIVVVTQDNEGQQIASGSGFFFDVRIGGRPRLTRRCLSLRRAPSLSRTSRRNPFLAQ